MVTNDVFDDRFAGTLRSCWTINRYSELIPYNVAYFLIIAGLATEVVALEDYLLELVVLFAGTVTMKAQASVADALHDYEVDRENPEKSFVANAVDRLGVENAWTFLFVQGFAAMAFWGYLSWTTGNPLFFAAGLVANLLGFTYSWPPRFKERGILNHVVTTFVDVGCIIYPGLVLVGVPIDARTLVVIGIIWCYSFAYHVMHQAGDTYYDRRSGVATFTQKVGLAVSLAFTVTLMAVSVALSLVAGYALMAVVTLVYAGYFVRMYLLARGEPERTQTEIVNSRFSTTRCATVLNLAMAVSAFLSGAVVL